MQKQRTGLSQRLSAYHSLSQCIKVYHIKIVKEEGNREATTRLQDYGTTRLRNWQVKFRCMTSPFPFPQLPAPLLGCSAPRHSSPALLPPLHLIPLRRPSTPSLPPAHPFPSQTLVQFNYDLLSPDFFRHHK